MMAELDKYIVDRMKQKIVAIALRNEYKAQSTSEDAQKKITLKTFLMGPTGVGSIAKKTCYMEAPFVKVEAQVY